MPAKKYFQFFNLVLCFRGYPFKDFLIDGRRSTIGGLRLGGLTFNLNNGTKTPLIIVKNLENTFLGMKKVRAWPILTLAMPYVKTEQIQNLALF